LIDFARARVDHLDVVICVRPDQKIGGDLRQAWLKEIHPDANVIQVPDICDDENSQAWADYTRNFLGYAPNVVFTSEAYGEEYSRMLGAQHILVDRARQQVPISATAIRRDPLANWEFLEPCVRAWFAIRICVGGAESTGTTTMARMLAEHFHTLWVPEYGRDHWVEKMEREGLESSWKTEEFVHIATEQQRLEDAYARRCSGLLVCDTDALATSIWHERYVGFCSHDVREIAKRRSYALYLLTDCDIPFIQDGTRDGEHKREWMTRRFKEELTANACTWKLLSGTIQQRMNAAIAEIEAVVARRPTSLDPKQTDTPLP
jgi:NadR type nicotinamide-nucleotide adenylyltransferase